MHRERAAAVSLAKAVAPGGGVALAELVRWQTPALSARPGP
jgi:hypothetical protein